MKKLMMIIVFLILAAPFANSKAPSEYQFKSYEWWALERCGQQAGQCIPPN
jgi:hypothetical protein